MTERTIVESQRAWARVAGYALLAIIVVGLAGTAIQTLGISGSDVQRILAHGLRYRVGLACEFVMLNNDILLAVALYALLKSVNAPLALLGTLWRFANAAMLGMGIVAAITALKALADTGETQGLASHLLRMHDVASLIGLTFWSLGAAVHSYLLWQSGYIPRILSGAYLAVAAIICAGCFAIIIFPAIDAVIDPWFVLPDLPVELAVALWLMIKGAAIPEPAGQP